jgi:hypothetical protein
MSIEFRGFRLGQLIVEFAEYQVAHCGAFHYNTLTSQLKVITSGIRGYFVLHVDIGDESGLAQSYPKDQQQLNKKVLIKRILATKGPLFPAQSSIVTG